MVTGDRTFKTSSSNADVGEAVYCTDTGPNNGDVMVIGHMHRAFPMLQIRAMH